MYGSVFETWIVNFAVNWLAEYTEDLSTSSGYGKAQLDE